MQPETIEAVKKTWSESTIENQKALIKLFLERYNTVEHDYWMEFLHEQFGGNSSFGSIRSARGKKARRPYRIY